VLIHCRCSGLRRQLFPRNNLSPSLLDDAIELVNEAKNKYAIPDDDFTYSETLAELHHSKNKEARLIPMHEKMKDKQMDLRTLKSSVCVMLRSVITDLKKREE
jgi:hypothetical protein